MRARVGTSDSWQLRIEMGMVGPEDEGLDDGVDFGAAADAIVVPSGFQCNFFGVLVLLRGARRGAAFCR